MLPTILQGTSQSTTLKNAIAANTNQVIVDGVSYAINAVPKNGDGAAAVAAWYNQMASPAFWLWYNEASLTAVGMALKMSDVGGLTTANSTRLQVSFQVRPNGFNPSVQDDRSLFGSLFSVSGASGTRANLLALWQHQANNAEKVFATGTGTQATGDLNSDGSVTAGSPGTTTEEGLLTGAEVLSAWNS